jgi:hypothetical protein
MYFMDFVKTELISPPYRYFLSGENDFLKNYIIDIVARKTGRHITRVESAKEIVPNESLFDLKKLYILSGKSNPKSFYDYTMKLSKSKMGKTFSEAGFQEILCSNLFPNQIDKLTSIWLKKKGLPIYLAKDIARQNKFDPYSIHNTIEVLSFLDSDITIKELNAFCANISSVDMFKTIDYFIGGNYTEFMESVESSQFNIHEVLWALLRAIAKLQQAYASASGAVTWYQKKMVSAAGVLAPYGFERIIPYLNSLCISYGENREILVMRLLKLIFYLRGVIQTI